jgi:hypothetical protein
MKFLDTQGNHGRTTRMLLVAQTHDDERLLTQMAKLVAGKAKFCITLDTEDDRDFITAEYTPPRAT